MKAALGVGASAPDFSLPCVVRYYDDGWRLGIFFKRGRDFVSLITLDGMLGQSIHIKRWLKSREREFTGVSGPGLLAVYPVGLAAERWIRAAKNLGMTKSAEEILQSLAAGKLAPAATEDKAQAVDGEANMNVRIEVDKDEYKETKAASGRKSLDTGDATAKLLRGKSLEEVYELTSSKLGESVRALKLKYGRLNPGMQRMNLGNRLRKGK